MNRTAAISHADTLVRGCDTLRRTVVRVAACALVVAAGCSSSTTGNTTAAMDEMWSEQTEQERLAFCAEVRLDPDDAIATFMDAEPEFDIVAVRDWLAETCA